MEKLDICIRTIRATLEKMITDTEERESKTGIIDNGPFAGFYLKPLLQAMQNSSYDFPSAMMHLHGNDPNQQSEIYPMHPTEYPEIIAEFQRWDKNITIDDLEFDT